jgi:hypothetical protein
MGSLRSLRHTEKNYRPPVNITDDRQLLHILRSKIQRDYPSLSVEHQFRGTTNVEYLRLYLSDNSSNNRGLSPQWIQLSNLDQRLRAEIDDYYSNNTRRVSVELSFHFDNLFLNIDVWVNRWDH